MLPNCDVRQSVVEDPATKVIDATTRMYLHLIKLFLLSFFLFLFLFSIFFYLFLSFFTSSLLFSSCFGRIQRVQISISKYHIDKRV